MVSLLEVLYALTVVTALIAIVAAVQRRGARPDRVEHYRRRMRNSALLALIFAVLSAGMYYFLSVE